VISRSAPGGTPVQRQVALAAAAGMLGSGLFVAVFTGAASRAGPALIQCIGVSMLASGPFTTDPSAMFDQHSAPGETLNEAP
jgi:hypothetical protein